MCGGWRKFVVGVVGVAIVEVLACVEWLDV